MCMLCFARAVFAAFTMAAVPLSGAVGHSQRRLPATAPTTLGMPLRRPLTTYIVQNPALSATASHS